MQELKTEELCLHKDHKQLLQDVSVIFAPGKLHAIIGPNGSGKSTLLRALAGIWQPTAGCVSWKGQDLRTLSRKEISRAIALVPQSPQTSFNFLVVDVVAMGRYSYDPHYWNSIETPIIAEALQAVDATHLRYRRINELSFGERQRVYIARALVTGSPVILLDEPTAGLDIRHERELMALLQQLLQAGKIVVITTHDLSLAEEYEAEVTIIKNGRCLGSGPFGTLMTEEMIHHLFDLKTTKGISYA
jgi:iron complex transport system ATP-binding protein